MKFLFLFLTISALATENIAYVANFGGGSVTVIDTEMNSIVTTIMSPDFMGPREIAFSPDGKRAYVSNLGSTTVSVVDVATHSETVA